MNIDHLVKMANEISAFFVGESPEEAPQQIASHMKKFWEPRMRRDIVAHFNKGGGGLSDAARSAVALLAAESSQGAQTAPAAVHPAGK
ncbi:MAG TPA: formate dehydrogenase subunit delta [Steroidobacteraceae bacterium]